MSIAAQVREWLAEDPARRQLSGNEAADAMAADGIGGRRSARSRAFLRAKRDSDPTQIAASFDVPTDDLGTEADPGDSVDIQNSEYGFRIAGKTIAIPFDAVEDIVAHYVHGAGGSLTQAEACRRLYAEHGISVTQVQMRRILSLLGVRKTSTPFAPHELAEMDEDDDEGIVDAWREKIEATIESKILRDRDRQYRRLYEKERKARAEVDTLLARVVESCPTRPIVLPPPVTPRTAHSQSVAWVFCLSDWHVGVDTEHAKRCVDELVHRWRLRRQWDTRTVRSLLVCVAGDLLDGAGAEMHPGHHTEQDLHGYEQATTAAAMLAKCVRGIAECAPGAPLNVACVPGNHDRATRSRPDSHDYVLGRVVYTLAEAWAGVGEWSHFGAGELAQIRLGSGRVLLTHGCTARPKKDGRVRDLLHSHRDPSSAWDLVVTGHLHEPMMMLDAHQAHVRGGALKRGKADKYARGLGYAAEASQVLVEVDPATGLRAVHVERF